MDREKDCLIKQFFISTRQSNKKTAPAKGTSFTSSAVSHYADLPLSITLFQGIWLSQDLHPNSCVSLNSP
jgi:hypothetical protein